MFNDDDKAILNQAGQIVLNLTEEEIRYFAHYHSCGVTNAVRFWLESEDRISAEQFADYVTRGRFGALEGMQK